MGWLADVADLNRKTLYRILSLRGNPRFFNLLALLDAVGLELTIRPREKRKQNPSFLTIVLSC